MNDIISGVEYDISYISLRDDGLYELDIVDSCTGEIVCTVIQGNPGACTIGAKAVVCSGGGLIFLVP